MDSLDDDQEQSNSSDKSDEESYENGDNDDNDDDDDDDDDDDSEFANKEINECANEEIAQGSKTTPRSTKIKPIFDLSSDPLSIKKQGFLNRLNLYY